MDNQFVLATMLDKDNNVASSKKNFTKRTALFMSFMFAIDLAAIILQGIIHFSSMNADVYELLNVIGRDAYLPVHIFM